MIRATLVRVKAVGVGPVPASEHGSLAEHWRPDGVARCRWIPPSCLVILPRHGVARSPQRADGARTGADPGLSPYRSRHHSRMSGPGQASLCRLAARVSLSSGGIPRRALQAESGSSAEVRSALQQDNVMRYVVAHKKLNSGASLSATDAGKAVPDRRIMIGGQP